MLIEMGYLNTVRYRFGQKNYYVATAHGYKLILYMRPGWQPAKPLQQIDVRTFDHDVQVMRARLHLEEFENINSWQSDRQLKCQYPEYFRFSGSRDSAPDGVYQATDGRIIAFEYEIAQKSRKRYRDKMQSYHECLIRKAGEDGPKYDQVHIVCEKESVYRALVDATSLYKPWYSIERAQEFFSRTHSETPGWSFAQSCSTSR